MDNKKKVETEEVEIPRQRERRSVWVLIRANYNSFIFFRLPDSIARWTTIT